MIETMEDAAGVGLAAPQVHVARRLIVFRVPVDRREEGEPEVAESPTALINPVIEPVGDGVSLGLEGCLSIPGLRGLVPRHHRIRYHRSEEHTSELQSLMRISYAVFCLKKKNTLRYKQ